MIPNTWSKGWYCSNFCLSRDTAEQPSSFHLGPTGDVRDIYFSRNEAGSHVMPNPLRSLGREAKRARVENIIRGMSSSPDVSDANPQVIQEGTNKSISLYQNQMGMFEMHQPENQYQFCKKDKVNNQDGNHNILGKTFWDASHKLPRNSFIDMYHEVKPRDYSQLKAEKVKLMKDVLKCELSKALSTSVDTIFKTKTRQETSERPLHHHLCSSSISFSEMSAPPLPATQTEALSLVVQNDKPHPVSHCTNYDLKYFQKPPKNLRQAGYKKGQIEMSDRSWCPLKVRSKVDPRPERSLHAVSHAIMKSLPLSRVKQSPGESSSLNMYRINEGLTTNHLKKAKLMFFYTRYPSSFVLKMCFSDVQFTRCITSQLIKWFSNFREFFYIQMEKFARNAVLRGAGGDGTLAVGRESELFRVLNLHYNKTSDFQVPDRFLEVAEITLREFYIAICLGKDRDPSWKKAIYRVISKLDSEVPAHFILTSFI